MSLNINSRDSQLSNISTDYAGGTLTIYSGTAPANADAALGGATALAAHTVPGFNAPANGSMTAQAIADDTIDATGTATFARLVNGANTVQLTVGTAAADIIVPSTSYVTGGTSSIDSLTVSQPAS